MHHVVSLFSAFAHGPEAAAPTELHLVPAGEFRGVDGRGPFRLDDPQAVIAASREHLPLPVDEMHATDLALATGAPAPARGWITALHAREDGIWGTVEWTAAGRELVQDRAYRGISPAIRHTAPAQGRSGGRVLAVLRASLTNLPNLRQLATLHSQEKYAMDLLAELRALHGLPADADAAAALNACRHAREAAEGHATALNSIAAAAGLPAGQDARSIAAAITAARASAGEAGKMREELVSLQTQLAEITARQAREQAARVVDDAIRQGKPITKALREHYIARHSQDPAAVEKELAALPSLHHGGITAPPAAQGGAGIGAEEAHVLSLMGIKPDAYTAERKRLGLCEEAA
jgi:phage I-like protein